jgi:succinate dehydrogenase/fumarate reductase-like Fe-S protein
VDARHERAARDLGAQALEQDPDLRRLEERMDPELADKIYELDRCIECGCCVAACGTARMREDFVGAVGLNKIARFALDPRDQRTTRTSTSSSATTTACSAA